MQLIVVTKVPEPESGRNLALNMDIYVQTDLPSEANGYLGRYKNLAELQPLLAISLRTPVFRLGEILVLDENDRDQFGRKPSKWDIQTGEFATLERAIARVKQLTADQDEPKVIEEYPDHTARQNGPQIIGEPCPWCGMTVEGPDHSRSHD